MKNPYKVFHSREETLQKHIHLILVRPENPGNVGSVARSVENMGIEGSLTLVGRDLKFLDEEARKFAVHAQDALERIRYAPTLESVLMARPKQSLTLAATARVGSSSRPHPLRVREAMERAMQRLSASEIEDLYLVFGPESDGLTNPEVSLCDWVVTIPSSPQYRSLNLAQSVLIFLYEARLNCLLDCEPFQGAKGSERDRLVMHFIQLAETVGFILPGDPHKMRPRLEEILKCLPLKIEGVSTLHGFLDQAVRSVRKGEIDYKGRYGHEVYEEKNGRKKERSGIEKRRVH